MLQPSSKTRMINFLTLECSFRHLTTSILLQTLHLYNVDSFNRFATNLTWWKETKITEQLESWMRINRLKPLWIWGSQAPLALVFYDKWMELSSHWFFGYLHSTRNTSHGRHTYSVPRSISLTLTSSKVAVPRLYLSSLSTNTQNTLTHISTLTHPHFRRGGVVLCAWGAVGARMK